MVTKGHQEGKPRIPERQQCPHPGPRTRRHFPSVPGSVGSMPRKCQGLGLGRAHARVPGRQPCAHGCSHTPSPAEQEPQCCHLQSTEWHLLRRFSRLFLARNSSLAWAAHPTPTEGSLTCPALVGQKRSDQRVLCMPAFTRVASSCWSGATTTDTFKKIPCGVLPWLVGTKPGILESRI